MTDLKWYKTHHPEYFATRYGDVRTFDRCEYMPYKNTIRKVHRKGKILNPIKMNNVYFYIDLAICGKKKRISVYRLIAQTFLEENINDKHIHHIDGNKKNNSASNLEIVDQKLHCSEHNFERLFKNKTGYRGSIQRSGKKTIYTKIYDNPKDAYEEIQSILNLNRE